MSYTIAQKAEYAPRSTSSRVDWWKWGVWIEASDAELDLVKAATWLLHPSFPQPERTVSDRTTKFRLDSAGWGTFMISCELQIEGGEDSVILEHQLELEYPEGESRTPARKGVDGAVVYLSFPSETSNLVHKIQKKLESEGVRVLNINNAQLGIPLAEASRQMICAAHAVVAIQDGQRPSEFVRKDVEEAAGASVPTMQFMVGGNEGQVSSESTSTRAPFLIEHVDTYEAQEPMAERIMDFLRETE